MAKYVEGIVNVSNDELCIEGDLYIVSNSRLVVDGNLYVNGELNLGEHSRLEVKGSLEVIEYLVCNYAGSIQAGSITSRSRLTVCDNAHVTIEENVFITGALVIKDRGSIRCNDIIVEGDISITNGSVTAGGDIEAFGLLAKARTRVYGESLTITNALQIEGGSSLEITTETRATEMTFLTNSFIETRIVTAKLTAINSTIQCEELTVNSLVLKSTQLLVMNRLVCETIEISETSKLDVDKDMRMNSFSAKNSQVSIKGSLYGGKLLINEGASTRIIGDLSVNALESHSMLEVSGDMLVTGHAECKAGFKVVGQLKADTLRLENGFDSKVQGDIHLNALCVLANASIETQQGLFVKSIDENHGVIGAIGLMTCQNLVNKGKLVLNGGLQCEIIENHGSLLVEGNVSIKTINSHNVSDMSVTGNVVIDHMTLRGVSIQITGTLTVRRVNMISGEIIASQGFETNELVIANGGRVHSQASVTINNATMSCESKLSTDGILIINGNVVLRSWSSIRSELDIYILGNVDAVSIASIYTHGDLYIHGCLCVKPIYGKDYVNHGFERLVTEIEEAAIQDPIESITCTSLFVKRIESIYSSSGLRITRGFVGQNNGPEIERLVVIGDAINDRLMNRTR